MSAARAARGPFAPSSASFRSVPGSGMRSITKRDQHRGRGGVVEGGWAAGQRAVHERGRERAGAAETLPRALLFHPRTKSTMRQIDRPAHSCAENGDGEEGLSGALETGTSQLDAGVRLCTHSWSCYQAIDCCASSAHLASAHRRCGVLRGEANKSVLACTALSPSRVHSPHVPPACVTNCTNAKLRKSKDQRRIAVHRGNPSKPSPFSAPLSLTARCGPPPPRARPKSD